jgi:hypothetical protein
MTRSDAPSKPKASTKMSYTLVPFSVLSLASQSMGPPVLPGSVLEASDAVFPFLVRVVELRNTGRGATLPIMPHETCMLELEFFSFHTSEFMPCTSFEFRVDVEYVTGMLIMNILRQPSFRQPVSEFPGVETFLTVPLSDDCIVENKAPTPAEKREETIFSRRSFILNEVVLVSSIQMERVVPLTQICSELRGSAARMVPAHIEYPFLPECMTGSSAIAALRFIEACLRSLGISLSQYQHQHQRRMSADLGGGSMAAVNEEEAGTSAKRQGLRFREFSIDGGLLLSAAGLQVACFNERRLFSIQVAFQLSRLTL